MVPRAKSEWCPMPFAGPALFALLGAAAAPAAPSLDALLSRAHSASGAPYRFHLVSKSTELVDGRSYDITTESEGPRGLIHRCLRDVCGGSYFDGERIFDVNLNDTALPRTSNTIRRERTLRAIVSYAFAAADFRARGGQIDEHPPVVRSGRTLRQLAVRAVDGAAALAFIDPRTGLLAAVAEEGSTPVDYDDVRTIEHGVRVPFALRRDGRVLVRYTTRAVVDSPLSAPAGLVPDVDAAATAAPLRRAASGETPVVPCSLDEKTATCLLDTGTSGLSISLEFAEELGLEPSGEFRVQGLGSYLTGIVQAGPLRVAGATFPRAKYVVLHDIHQYGYDVVLGADVFAHSRVTVDYPAHLLSFTPNDRPATAASIALTFEGLAPVVAVRFGALDAALTVDTGDQSSINLTGAFYDAHPELFVAHERAPVAGVGGIGEQLVGVVKAIRIGEIEARDQPIGVTRALRTQTNGHLGSAFLARFAVIFDYAHARIGFLERRLPAKK